MVLEAGYAGTTGFRKVVKVTVFVTKKDGMTDADFIDHYNKKHARMAADVLLKHNIISYSLVRCPGICRFAFGLVKTMSNLLDLSPPER
jgi:hypothetical protein